MLQLTWDQVPQSFAICRAERCPLAAQCLHFSAYLVMPDYPSSPVQQIAINAHLQAAAECGEECPAFLSATPKCKARGFTKALNSLSVKEAAAARQELQTIFSRGTFYSRRNGQTSLNQEEQKTISDILLRHGAQSPVSFDSYEEVLDFDLQ